MLELDDGTALAQSIPILNYVAATYGFHPETPMQVYHGQKVQAAVDDIISGKMVPAIFAPAGPERDAKFEELKGHYSKVCDVIAKNLKDDQKFLCGNKLTTHDFTIAGIFVNLVTNPNAKDADWFKAQYEGTPDRVKKYVADFREEMKDYLAERDEKNGKCTL